MRKLLWTAGGGVAGLLLGLIVGGVLPLAVLGAFWGLAITPKGNHRKER